MNEFLGNVLGIAIILVLWLVVGYLYMGFILWDLDVANWTSSQRNAVALLSVSGTIVTLIWNGRNEEQR